MADEKIKMKILRNCFVSDAVNIVRDGKTIERRKLFKDEEFELPLDEATTLDELGFAKQVIERRPIAAKPKAEDGKAAA